MRPSLPALALLGCTALTPGSAQATLVAHYSFDGNSLDSSGNGNDATAADASLTADRFGNADSAYRFNGSSSYAEKWNPTGVNIGSQAWTLSAWVNTSGSSSVQQIVSRYECGWQCSAVTSSAFYSLALVNNHASLSIRGDSDVPYSVMAADTISSNAWHMVSGVLDRSDNSLKLYVDGVLAATSAFAPGEVITDSGSPLEIGRWFRQSWASPANYFSGAIDDVRIYNNALSATEVRALFDGTTLPEPGSAALLGLGAALAFRRKRPRSLSDLGLICCAGGR